MVRNPKMDPPRIKTSCGTRKKNFNPMGIGLGNDYVTCWEILKWIAPQIKTSCGTQKRNSNPIGIGLGMDYVKWWEILKWIPPTLTLNVGHEIKIPMLWV